MKRYQKGDKVRPGFYLNLKTGEYVHLDKWYPVLPEKMDGDYIRIPAALVAVTVPLAGLAYVIYVPLAAFVGLLAFTGIRTKRMVDVRQEQHQT
jgi:hypothetical protein